MALETTSRHNYSTRISERRKVLFPDSDNDSDLGHMSPLSTDSNPDLATNNTHSTIDNIKKRSKLFESTIEDYVVLENVKEPSFTAEPGSESNMSALYLSPIQSATNSPVKNSLLSSQFGKSPSSNMKTPHDNSTVKQNSKLTKRKLLDGIEDGDSPECKNVKFDLHKSSKVRTSLFHDTSNDMFLPTKSFYPSKSSEDCSFRPILSQSFKNFVRKPVNVPKRRHSLGNRRKFGQINAGVGHKIRKPKQKKLLKTSALRAALNIIEKSPLNDYLEELGQFKNTTIKPLPQKSPSNAQKSPENQEFESEENKENLPENSTRKFFKTKRSLDKESPSSPPKNAKRKFDETYNFDTSIETPSVIADLINYLDQDLSHKDSVEAEDTSQISASQVAIEADLILSPTSQMCDMASGLDLNSPKRAKLNVTNILEQTTNDNNKSNNVEKKMFPLFYGAVTNIVSKATTKKEQTKRLKPTSDDQMILDAGQKKFGATECHVCNFVYDAGDVNDEILHEKHHSSLNTFKYNGWKNERVVFQPANDVKILKIIPGDPKAWWNKANEVLDFANRELGFYDGILPIDKSQVYFYIKQKQIVGFLVAELKYKAYKLLTSEETIDLCSQESYPIRCGISRLWVAENHRRCGVAHEMVNTLRRNFLYGYFLKSEDIALSSPTEAGKKFAQKYFANENFLIYIN